MRRSLGLVVRFDEEYSLISKTECAGDGWSKDTVALQNRIQ